MAIPKSEFIWFNGEFVPWDKAKVHVLSHALHYGTSVFEGIRAYQKSATETLPLCSRRCATSTLTKSRGFSPLQVR